MSKDRIKKPVRRTVFRSGTDNAIADFQRKTSTDWLLSGCFDFGLSAGGGPELDVWAG